MQKLFIMGLALLVTCGIVVAALPTTVHAITTAATSSFSMTTTPTYVEGKYGYALQVGTSDVPVATFSEQKGFNPDEGTIEAWVKPTDWTAGTSGYWEIISGVDQNGNDLYEFRRGKDSRVDQLQFVAYRASGFQLWTTQSFTWADNTWYHLAVTWSETEQPTIYVNGTAYTTSPSYGVTTWEIKDFTSGANYLGTRGNESVRQSSSSAYSGRAAFDEVRVSNVARPAGEIQGSYNSGVGRKLNVDSHTLWVAHFDKSLTLDTTRIAQGTSFLTYGSWIRGGFHTTSGNVLGGDADEIITGTGTGMAPQVRVFDRLGMLKSQFFAYDRNLRNGVTISACDVTGDGYDEIVTAQGHGGWPLVKIFDGYGQVLNDGFFVLDGKYSGGINLSCGDTDGDGTSEIVVAAMRGGGPQVMVYNANGRILTNFMAYDRAFRGGINVTTADADGDGKDEIITGPQYGASHVQIFQIRSGGIHRLSPGFMAFDSDYRGGITVAGVDTNGDGTKEIVVGVGAGAAPAVKVYNIREQWRNELYVYADNFDGGLQLAGGDVNNDGADELLVIPRSKGGPQLRVVELK